MLRFTLTDSNKTGKCLPLSMVAGRTFYTIQFEQPFNALLLSLIDLYCSYKACFTCRANAARILARMEEFVFLYIRMIRIIVSAKQTQPGSPEENTVKLS